MSIIALVGNKGGAGKTTLAVNMATVLGRSSRTAVFDSDPQASALQWRAISTDDTLPPVYDTAWTLDSDAFSMADEFDHVFIDCPPSVNAPQTDAVLQISDVVLIPVQPSPLDLWATVHIDQAVQRAREVNPRLKARLVINQLEPRTRLSRLIRDALEELELPAATTTIKRRAIYRNSVLEGKSVMHMGRQGTSAAVEMQDLLSEVVTI